MRIGITAVLAASLLASAPAFAADDQGTLAPGNAAGVEQAQDISIPIMLSIAGVVGVAVAVGVLVSNGHKGASATTTSAAH
jgi:hypothetical protein